MVTVTSEFVQTNWQTVDVTRPLSSVRQICMQGVLFGAQGGVIYNIERVDTKLRPVSRTTSMSLSCGYHRASRGVLVGRDESLVCR